MSEERWLVLSPNGMEFAIGPNRNVVIRLDYPREYAPGQHPR